MSLIVVDVEADGPCPGSDMYSMVCFGAIRVQEDLENAPTFYGRVAPISDKWNPEALAISGISREEHMTFPSPAVTMLEFDKWVRANTEGSAILCSDNNQFDGMFVAHYLHRFVGNNVFGFSSRRIGDMFGGFNKDLRYSWKKHRKTSHTHHPVDDARGNAEALLYLRSQGCKIKL